MEICFAAPSTVGAGTLVVGVLDDRAPTTQARTIDEATDGLLTRAMAASPKFKGGAEQILAIPAPGGLAADRLVLIGLGKVEKLSVEGLAKVGGALQAHLVGSGVVEARVDLGPIEGAPIDAEAMAAAIGFGARLRSYRFDRYRTTEKPDAKPSLTKLVLTLDAHAAAAALFAVHDRVADGVFFSRDLASEPANLLYPESFADRCQALTDLGVEVEVLDVPALEEIGMGALLGVGLGSERPSRVVIMRWKGADSRDGGPVALLGKGVTFDTGGISLKPGAGMWDMKWDMGGAGAVCGAMKAIAGRKAKADVVGVIGLVENMPDGKAQRPGDVVTSLSGQTIEVLNTDAEGRLVLADVLYYTQDRFKPCCMVDLATLTGAVMVALGQEQAGLFANHDELADQLTAAGKAVGEPVWRLPLGEAYSKQIDSDIADVKNIAGNRYAGSIIGAVFLEKFINGQTRWAHLDVAGMVWSSKDTAIAPKGATGYGARLLDRFVADNFEG